MFPTTAPRSADAIWPSLHGEFVVGEPEVVLQPIEEGGLEDAAAAVERVAGEPDQLRLAEAQLAGGFELLAQLLHADDFAQAHGRRCD